MHPIQHVKEMSEELATVKPGKFMVASPWTSKILPSIHRLCRPCEAAVNGGHQAAVSISISLDSLAGVPFNVARAREKFDALPEAHSYRFRGS
jgi:hypothetical protein